MFIGTYTRSLDDKQRFALPKELRGELEGELVVARVAGGHLELYPRDEFADLLGRLKAQVRAAEKPVALYEAVAGSARPVSLDGQNRIKLPLEILDDEERTQDLVLTGMGESIRIRPASRQAQIDNQMATALLEAGPGDLL